MAQSLLLREETESSVRNYEAKIQESFIIIIIIIIIEFLSSQPQLGKHSPILGYLTLILLTWRIW
jgi:hypothetical protein